MRKQKNTKIDLLQCLIWVPREIGNWYPSRTECKSCILNVDFTECVFEGSCHKVLRLAKFGDPQLGDRVAAPTKGPSTTPPRPYKLKLFREQAKLAGHCA